MDKNKLETNAKYEADYQKQKYFSITTQESIQIEKEYEINDIIVNLNKALSKVGNITILEAISLLEKQTRFANELKNKIYYGNVNNYENIKSRILRIFRSS